MRNSINVFREGQRSLKSCVSATKIISHERYAKLPKYSKPTTSTVNNGMQILIKE